MSRPLRRQARDFAGRLFTLPESDEFWEIIRDPEHYKSTLILGPGPDAATRFSDCDDVWWAAPPDFPEELTSQLPACWKKIDGDIPCALADQSQIFFYNPARRMSPEFWGPLLGKLRLLQYGDAKGKRENIVWLPGNGSQLLHIELEHALRNSGSQKILTAMGNPAEIMNLLAGKRADFALSVNFRGLDGRGEIFDFLMAAQIPLAVWLVDNPWNLLSGIELPWWKEADLFVTDASFIGPLRKLGARKVHFLPLGAPSHMWMRHRQSGHMPPLFIGRSEFPGKEKFFAGARPDVAKIALAENMVSGPDLPDVHWWTHETGKDLWPGKHGRSAILGAEESSRKRRGLWVRSAAECGLAIIGDEGWKNLAPGVKRIPPVDYYQKLPGVYAVSDCILNVTSLLLPESLNQRHFDVWAAGGFLLTDVTKGLEIFPSDLVDSISLQTPAHFCEKYAHLKSCPAYQSELAQEWREVIFKEHRYENRIEQIKIALDLV